MRWHCRPDHRHCRVQDAQRRQALNDQAWGLGMTQERLERPDRKTASSRLGCALMLVIGMVALALYAVAFQFLATLVGQWLR